MLAQVLLDRNFRLCQCHSCDVHSTVNSKTNGTVRTHKVLPRDGLLGTWVGQSDENLRARQNSLQVKFDSALNFAKTLPGTVNLAVFRTEVQISVGSYDVGAINCLELARDWVFVVCVRNRSIDLNNYRFPLNDRCICLTQIGGRFN